MFYFCCKLRLRSIDAMCSAVGRIDDLMHSFSFKLPSFILILITDSVNLSNFWIFVRFARFFPWSTVFLGSLTSTTYVWGWFVAPGNAVLLHNSLRRLNNCSVPICRSCWNCYIGVVMWSSVLRDPCVPSGVRVQYITWL